MKKDTLNKGARIYVDSALSAATHPVRREILKLLKKDSQSTLDIGKETNENRYNIYHHLKVLEKSGLIKLDKKKSKKSEGKLQYYKMNYVKKPVMAAFSFDEVDIKEKSGSCKKLYKTIEEIEDYDLPDTKRVSKIEVYLTYNWGDKLKR
jgi:DNA-binding transcriptional ArsR family regulator|tara:strand:- start:659 stop:1108 length:450 start_codon:yes stop_codon:yes gene_type:complete